MKGRIDYSTINSEEILKGHQMTQRIILIIGVLSVLLMTGCDGNTTLTDNVATLNAAATKAAGGDGGSGSGESTPEPTALPANYFDLTADPGKSLANAWGTINGLPGGQEFTVIASEQQVGTYIIERLQLSGWEETVRGGSVTIGSGQIRLDVALVDEENNFGSGTITFQPTLDELGQVHLNPLGADFGTFDLPNDLLAAFGDQVNFALGGAPNESLIRVSLTRISLEDEIMQVEGKTR